MAKILIAEDDPRSRDLLHKNLETWGHDVVPTSDGAEALAKFDTETFDLIVSDWMMPNLTGIELCETIKKRQSDVPLIMLSTNRAQRDIDRAYQAGVDDYVTKPFDKNDLQSRISKALS